MQKMLFATFLLLSIGVSAYALVAYVFFPLGAFVHPDMQQTFNQHKLAVYGHILGSLVALSLGPFQFSQSIRDKHTQFHRWSGRIYLLCGIGIGGICGVYIAQFAFGGAVSAFGFSLLGVLWLITGVAAYFAVRQGRIDKHREWMIRGMSLTFAAVTLRIQLGLFSLTDLAFETFYPWVAWLCWVPNLLCAELIFIRRKNHQRTSKSELG